MPLDLQLAYRGALDIPSRTAFMAWCEAALHAAPRQSAEFCVRVVGHTEMTRLNRQFRQRNTATNVLSFTADAVLQLHHNYLGDVVICAPRVHQEAAQQGKPSRAHWAHLCIHGMLHLLGFDHQFAQQAQTMEALEVDLLADLGYPNPYR